MIEKPAISIRIAPECFGRTVSVESGMFEDFAHCDPHLWRQLLERQMSGHLLWIFALSLR
jgi:hypothetical protein